MITIHLSATGAKEAVARLREFLAADGINLKQTHAYEAVAQTLGYANWNTLQALLNNSVAPREAVSRVAAPQPEKKPALTDEEFAAEVARRRGRFLPGLKLTNSLEQGLHRAIGFASGRHHEYATLEHLLLSLTEDHDAASILRSCGVSMEQLRKDLTDHIDNKLEPLVTTEPVTAKPTTTFQRVVQRAVLHVQNSGGGEVTGANVLVAMFAEPETRAVTLLQKQGMTRSDALEYLARKSNPLDGGQSG